MKTYLFSTFILALSLTAYAQSSAELREKAHQESKVDNAKPMASASEAQVNGLLILQDPYREEIRRNWKWHVGLQGQKISPLGTVAIPGITTQNLAATGSTLLPSINFGFSQNLKQMDSWLWSWGVHGQAGVSSQQHELILPSGYKPENTRLNTSLLQAGPFVALKNDRLSWLSLSLGAQIGSLAYTQTSQDGAANFAETAEIWGTSLGLHFDIAQNWQLSVESQKSQILNPEEKTISVQNESYSFGARVLW